MGIWGLLADRELICFLGAGLLRALNKLMLFNAVRDSIFLFVCRVN
jgi:hypothetical protein